MLYRVFCGGVCEGIYMDAPQKEPLVIESTGVVEPLFKGG